jgi:hypothetical protein
VAEKSRPESKSAAEPAIAQADSAKPPMERFKAVTRGLLKVTPKELAERQRQHEERGTPSLTAVDGPSPNSLSSRALRSYSAVGWSISSINFQAGTTVINPVF